MTWPAKSIKHNQPPWLFYLTRWWYWLTAVVLVVAVAVVGASLFWPLLKRESLGASLSYRDTAHRLVELQQQKAEVERIITAIQSISRDDQALLQAMLPTAQEIPTLLAQIDAITRQSGLVLTSFTVAEAQVAGAGRSAAAATGTDLSAGVKKLTLNLTFRAGQYDQFKQVVEALERNIRLIDITAMAFSPDAKGYTINAVTYYTAAVSPPAL